MAKTINDIPIHLIAATKMTWDRLDEKGQATLVAAATWPPDYLVPEWLHGQVSPLLNEDGGMARSVAESIVIIAERT